MVAFDAQSRALPASARGLDITRHAGDLAEGHGLRAYDAVHLASADAIADENTLLVAADGDLAGQPRPRASRPRSSEPPQATMR